MTGPMLVFLLCLATSGACAGLLARAHQRTGRRFLMWCAISFALLAINNALVVFDIMAPTNLLPFRQVVALSAIGILIYGFMWEQA